MPSRVTCNRSVYFGQSRKVSISTFFDKFYFQHVNLLIEPSFFLQIDLHLHSKDWDEQLKNENWKPEDIVGKLPEFLQFVKRVQSVISGELRHSNVDT